MNSNRVESGSLWVTSGRVLTLAFGCVLLLCGVATGSEKCGSIDRVATALQLVKAVYPEFQQQELDVGVGNWGNGSTLPTDGRSVLITIAPDSWHPPQWWKEHPEGPPPANTPVVWRDIELPVYLSFDFVKADGTLNYTPRCRPSFMHDHLSTGHRATIELVDAHANGMMKRRSQQRSATDYVSGQSNERSCWPFSPSRHCRLFTVLCKSRRLSCELRRSTKRTRSSISQSSTGSLPLTKLGQGDACTFQSTHSMEEYGAFRNKLRCLKAGAHSSLLLGGWAISFRPSSPEGAPSRLLLAKWDSLSIFACTPAHCLAVHSVSTSTTPGMPRA